MLKRERLMRIQEMIAEKGIVTASEIINALGVSDMTVRRDLDELEKNGKLIRIHGGAQSLDYNIDYELSHLQKATVKVEEKLAIAKAAVDRVGEHETIFLGPGTTIEMMAQLLKERNVRVITPSLAAFEALKEKQDDQILLVGGSYRSNTKAFCGPLANQVIASMKFNKAFISCNGIADNSITTSSMEEGELQKIACNNAKTVYLLADDHKFNREDFYVYYSLHNIDEVITDDQVSEDTLDHYRQFTSITVAPSRDQADEIREGNKVDQPELTEQASRAK